MEQPATRKTNKGKWSSQPLRESGLTVSLPLSGIIAFFVGGPAVLAACLVVLAFLQMLVKRPVCAAIMMATTGISALNMDWDVPFKFGMVAPALSLPLLLVVVLLNADEVVRKAAGATSCLGVAIVLTVLSTTEMRYVL